MTVPAYRLGPFHVDRAGYRVLRGGAPVNLTPKLLDLLLYLLDHPGTLVTKEELLDALWPDANVTENALTQAVSELRQVLGDDASAPTFIKTVARRGYRLIVPVETVGTPPAEPPADEPLDDAAAPAVAVMDFTNLTGQPDSAWLSSGIAETVTGDLGSLGSFRVVDRRRVAEAVRATDGSLGSVAAALGASLVVVGSFQHAGSQIRITARIVNVATGEAVADAKVDGRLDDIFALQDQVVGQFSSELGLPTSASRTTTGRDTASLEAFRAFTEGSLRLESLDVRQMPQAIADFARAVAFDSRYAQACAGLASAEFASYETTRFENEPAQALLDSALEHARQAVRLDDGLAEAHATLALLLVSAGQTNEAAAAARRAVAIDPSNWRHWFRLGHATWGDARLRAAARTLKLYPDFAFGHFQIAMVHTARGALAEAEAVLRHGAAVQDRQIERGGRYPALGLHWLLGMVRLALGDPAEAKSEMLREEALAEPHRLYGREYAMSARYGLGLAHLRDGRLEEAVESFRRALELYPDNAQANLALALALERMDAREESSRALERVHAAVAVLAPTRPLEAGLIGALLLAREDRQGPAAERLSAILSQTPPGFACWTWPVDDLISQLVQPPALDDVLARLADRAR